MKRTLLNRKFRYSYTNVTLKILLVNILVFMLTQLNSRLYYYLALVPSLIIYEKWWWQIVTYMFVHADIGHILFNMLALFIFGSSVERQIGSKEFLLFYLLTGALSGLFSFFAYYLSGTNVILVGASGAIYALLFAFAVLYPYAIIFVFGILPLRAPILIAVYAAIEIYNQLFSRGGNVAHLTHLAGFAVSYLYLRLRLRLRPMDELRRGR